MGGVMDEKRGKRDRPGYCRENMGRHGEAKDTNDTNDTDGTALDASLGLVQFQIVLA